MKLKKINAGLSLLTIALLFLHTTYQAFSFILSYQNLILTIAFGYALVASLSAHAVIGCIFVFGKHDSKKIAYPKLNPQTTLQRISMIMISVLLLPHMFSFLMRAKAAGSIFYYLLEFSQVLFFAAVFLHVSVSFSKALITFGILKDNKSRKIVDVIISILCGIDFAVTTAVILMTHYKIYGG